MINVLIVDDHDIVRAGICSLLTNYSDIRVIGAASSGEEAIKIAKEKNPHVILMDVRMPGIDGLESTKKLLRLNPALKVIALTVCGSEPFPTKLLQAGAAGYLTKGSGVDEMIKAIRYVYAGKRYIDPQVAQKLALKTVSDSSDNKLLDNLSERELQVMLLITAGRKVPEISKRLCLSSKTVNTYRYRLFEKLKVGSDVELTHIAIRHGLLELVETV